MPANAFSMCRKEECQGVPRASACHGIWEMVTLERRKHTNGVVERTMYLDKYYWQGFLFVWDCEIESVS